jgi:hypothetical protein
MPTCPECLEPVRMKSGNKRKLGMKIGKKVQRGSVWVHKEGLCFPSGNAPSWYRERWWDRTFGLGKKPPHSHFS